MLFSGRNRTVFSQKRQLFQLGRDIFHFYECSRRRIEDSGNKTEKRADSGGGKSVHNALQPLWTAGQNRNVNRAITQNSFNVSDIVAASSGNDSSDFGRIIVKCQFQRKAAFDKAAIGKERASQLGWVELGGAGVFRKEVTTPLGITEPVLA